MKPHAVLIAGPTASGKSALAIEVAKRLNGRVINADSMQIYSILRELTARPSANEMEDIDHRLFGHIAPSIPYSVAQWLDDASKEIANAIADQEIPIFVGGTGLYFKGLIDGLSDVPPIDLDIRRGLRDQSLTDLPSLFDLLRTEDEDSWKRLEPGDSQRIVRALEVVRSTGKPIGFWQGRATAPSLVENGKSLNIVLSPSRDLLHERIGKRFHQMIDNGAIDEVEALLRQDLDEEMPAMRAIGVKQIIAYLKGELQIEEAIELSIIATRQYAKRQSTWFRHQFDDSWHRCETFDEAIALI